MILNKEKILKNHRLCQAMFGTSKEEIENLLPIFSQYLIVHRYEIKPIRQNKIGQGRKGDLPTDLDKLLYILAYLKIYPTYDAMSVLSNHQRSKCGDSVKFLLPTLEMALKRKLVLPQRKAKTLEEIFRDNPELKDVFGQMVYGFQTSQTMSAELVKSSFRQADKTIKKLAKKFARKNRDKILFHQDQVANTPAMNILKKF